MTYPAPQAPQPQPRKSRGCLWAALIALGLFMLFGFVGCVALVASVDTGSSDSGQSASSSDDSENAEDGGGDESAETEEDSEGEAEAGVGDTVEDGAFAFTVTDVETGVSSIGDSFLAEEAQGQYVIVHVTVENIGDQAQMFDGSNQKLFDADGKEYSNDSSAEIALDNSDAFLTDINPGNKVDAQVVFDIPEGVEPASIELHDSMFSGGVTVSLS
ncbi:DUF4352 domain-containing protein [Thermobifida halotolerans]|uniref:DUF4352 domain-containing protein n=1 Tax=Thermobifida halotolerans TaxID=483545 RepID=A0A399G1W0_9ACTN|nr:DUF4352 domain-containing protein [Thermobifida halotolerans]UOE19317.1 DUF4352 domain-containing protein [Thermobifida halotolerans]